MSRTVERRAYVAMVAALALLAPLESIGQTLGELADAQRVKQQAELAKLQKEAADDLAKSAPAVVPVEPLKLSAVEVRRSAESQRPKVILHSLYARNGVWIAELAEGQRLTLALIGMQLNGQRITAIGQQGLKLSKPCSAADVRDKIQCGQRIVPVGGAI